MLIVLREEFLARLLSYADVLFSGLKDRYLLEPLRKPAARLAVTGPLSGTGRSFEPPAVEELLRQLMMTRIDSGTERTAVVEGEFVEPVLLQVVCQRLWAALPTSVSTITRAHVEDLNIFLARFYSDVVHEAVARSGVSERQIREWVGQRLITHPGGTRGTVHVGPKTTAGLPNEVVALLEGKLLRAEYRAGARWLEITHDSLLTPIEQSNRDFFRSLDNWQLLLADQLAATIRQSLGYEAVVFRLNDPYPLPVRWVAADPELAVAWSDLKRVAVSGAGWPLRATRWAERPRELAGTGAELADVLARVPTGRLLVLGGPGSGKTTLMLRLVLDLLERRQPGDRVPVLLPMSTWDPVLEGMPNWIARRLKDEYPFLVGRGPRGQQGSTSIWALITAGLILPILDGLDEMPDTVFGIAIGRVNDALASGQGLVITSRTEAYRRAVHSASGMNVTLNATAAVQLCPLDPEEVADYLASASGGSSAAARWAPVLAGLGTREPLRAVLATPLMVQLAKAIYTPRPGEHISRVPDPAELLSPSMTNQTSIETHLFEGFIPAAYKASLGHSVRWTAEMAERWLTFLARYLELRVSGTNIAWWELNKAVPGLARAILSIVAGALVGGLAIGLPIGLVTSIS